MKETLALLLTAHLIADFVFTRKLLEQETLGFRSLLIRLAVVPVTAGAAIGHWDHRILGFVATSLLVVALFELLLPNNIWVFLLDQGVRLTSLAVGAILFPTCAATGLWFRLLDSSQQIMLMKAATVVSAIVAVVLAGAIVAVKVLGRLSSPHLKRQVQGGLPNGGFVIGCLERALVLLLMWLNQPTGIGFLVTAKSILRFGDVKNSKDRQVTEYVIVGTLLSFGWAILASALAQMAWRIWPTE